MIDPLTFSFLLYAADDFELLFTNDFNILGVSNHLNSPLTFGVNEITLILAKPAFFDLFDQGDLLYFLKYHVIHYVTEVWLMSNHQYS